MADKRERKGYVSGTIKDSTPTSKTALFPRPRQAEIENNMNCCLIGENDEPELKCYAYQLSRFRWLLMILIYLFSLGLMWLVFYWRPDWKLKFTHYLSSFDKATSVFLEANDGTNRVFVSEIKQEDASVKNWAPYLFAKASSSQLDNQNRQIKPAISSSVSSMENSESGSESDSVEGGFVKYFHHHLTKYMWDGRRQTFVKIKGFDGNVTLQHIHDSANNAISQENQQDMLRLFGENVIHVKVPSYFALLVAEVLNPFYVFQLFACIFWMVDEYVTYATAILVISFISAVVSLITIRRERQSLHDMVEMHNNALITVIREIKVKKTVNGPSSSNGVSSAKEYVTEDIWIKDLVPGDIVVISPNGVHLSFDAALISGTCIVNESMLTGESIPVTKTPLAGGETEMGRTYKADLQKSHTLFCGTEIIQTRYYQDEVVRAVVVRTGFGTAKGQLVQSILFPKPVNLRLLRDAYRFVGVMFCVALIGFAASVYIQIQLDASIHVIMFKSIDIITITVPPALPLALTIGIIYAQNRLKKVHIHTISPQRINICGQVDVVAFDKTGTLTEDGFDLTCVISATENEFQSPMEPDDLKAIDKRSELLRCMATCHSLTLIDNKVCGDPLDIKMLEATGWELVEPKMDETTRYDLLQTTYVRPTSVSENDVTLSAEYEKQISEGRTSVELSKPEYEVGIIRQFPFLSSLKRASVIAKPLHSDPTDMVVYVKGAPEMIATLCSLVPSNFKSILKRYTREGHRVIAFSYKKVTLKWLKAQKIEREVLERDLSFLGFMVLQNKLKPSSLDVIRDLNTARIRNVMVTGDNLETAISVARECRILKSNVPVLIAECDITGQHPTLTWKLSEQSGVDGRRKVCLSSSEECNTSDTFINMGDSLAPFDCHLAVTGHEFSIIRQCFPKFVPALAVQGAVFARMSPHNKTELMEELEAVEHHTLMCGDGANDCGALKRAHVGLSLSEYDASVAAPFTARMENGIGSVTTLIREGRAALVTSFGMFKFIALYSMIQFATVLLLYSSHTSMSDYQFLYIDLIVIDLIALTMSRNHACRTLHWKKPASSLVCTEMLVSLILQIALQFGLQTLALILVRNQCWYRTPIFINETTTVPNSISHTPTMLPVTTADATSSGYVTGTTMDNSCPALANAKQIYVTEDHFQRTYETTTLVLLSSFLYLSVSVAFSQGKPFRTAIYKNRLFLGSLIILVGYDLFMMFGAPLEFDDIMDLWRFPDLKFTFVLLGIVIGHLLFCILIEIFFVKNPRLWLSIKTKLTCWNRRHVKKYKRLQEVLRGNFVPGESSRPYAANSHTMSSDGDILVPSQFEGQPVYSKVPFYQTSDHNIV